MCVKVKYFKDTLSVSINGQKYTKDQLERKTRNRLEQNILNTLKRIEQDISSKITMFQARFSDVEQLVRSDMFKGDNHSRPLLNGNSEE